MLVDVVAAGVSVSVLETDCVVGKGSLEVAGNEMMEGRYMTDVMNAIDVSRMVE